MFNTMLFENQYIERIDDIEDIDNDTEYFTITDTFDDDFQGGLLAGTKEKQVAEGN